MATLDSAAASSSAPVMQTTGRNGKSAVSPKWLRYTLVSMVGAFAFILASFPARNSDLWMHLAAGRDLTHGHAISTAIEMPANVHIGHAWLYDLVLYGLYCLIGGPGLVLVKALLVVALALILLRLSRAGSDWRIPALSVSLALLSMSTRLLLQPVTVSYFLLGLTLWLAGFLITAPIKLRSIRELWPLAIVFLLWVNLDAWVVIGLGTLALVWIGQSLDEDNSLTGRGRLLMRRLGLLVLLAVVCCLNPAHVFALSLPFDGIRLASPANLGQNPAGWAYYPLLGLGLLSFLLNLRDWQWQRFLPWLGLAVGSSLQVRMEPFFAVVAGPVLAWNLQEFFAGRFEREQPDLPVGRLGAVVIHGLELSLALAFLICAWPGWLQAPPYEPRRWAIDTNPSLERGATLVRQWRQGNKLRPESRGLFLSVDAAYTFAWYCPEERGALDRALAAALRGEANAPSDWDDLMRAQRLDHVIVYDPERGRHSVLLHQLLDDTRQWPLLAVEGDLSVFGWRDPKGPADRDQFAGRELNPQDLAFRAGDVKRAPRQRPSLEPQERPWWAVFVRPALPRPTDREEANLYLLYADTVRRSAPYRHLSAWEAQESAALIGAASTWTGPESSLDAFVRLVMLRPTVTAPDAPFEAAPILDRLMPALQRRFMLQRDDMPPALLYLAVRAARRALAVNPEDAQVYLFLGECYLRLLSSTRERAWSERFPELGQLRRTQACVALSQAILLKRDLAQAHFSLGGLYREMGYLDLSLHHWQAYFKELMSPDSPLAASLGSAREQAVAQARLNLSRLSMDIEELESAYARESTGLKVRDRAQLALQKGLAGKARDLLLESNVAAFGLQGIGLELELLLRTGQAGEMLSRMEPEQEQILGSAPYHWLRAQAFAATGDYALAEEECTSLANGGQAETPRYQELMALVVGQAMLDGWTDSTDFGSLTWRAFRRNEFRNRVSSLFTSMRQRADATVLHGLLALEEGDVLAADILFRLALAYWQEPGSGSDARMDFNARPIAQAFLQWLSR